MIKRLISFFLALVFLVAVPLSAAYRYNPYTRKLDYYEAAGDITLGDIGDITLTGLATGNILYYNGTAWVNLATGANTNILTLAGGIPSWAAPGAPAAHAPTHLAAGADPVDHDQLLNYLAAQHLTLPNTIVAVLTDHNVGTHTALGFATLPSTIALVLTDHNLLAHTALGLFDQSSDVDHNLTTNYLAAQHLTLPSTIAAVLTDHNKAAHDALLINADTVDGEHAAAIVTNARVKAHFPDTIANVLSDHNLAAHTALGLFDASADVDHDATTNWVANKHINWTAAADNFSTSEDFFLAWTEAADHASITQTSTAIIEDQALIYIDDDREDGDELSEATLVIDPAGDYSIWVKKGDAQFDDTVVASNFNTAGSSTVGSLIGPPAADLIINRVNNQNITLWSAITSGNPYLYIYGWDAGTASLKYGRMRIDSGGAFEIDAEETIEMLVATYFEGDTIQYEDVFITWADALDKMVIHQAAVAGTEDQPLIHIDDDRTGDTANEVSEATIYMDADGAYALYIADGYLGIADNVYFSGTTVDLADGTNLSLQEDITFTGATTENLIKVPDTLAAALILTEAANPYMTVVTTNGSEEIQFNVGVQFDTIAYFDAEYDEGAEGGAFTIDWTNGQKQKVTITGVNLDMSFTDPPGPCNVMLKIVQGDGDDTIDWTHDTKIGSAGGTAPTLSTGNADEDIFAFYFDGTNYWLSVVLDVDLIT